ncbi:MAG: hypothetical protein N3D18_04270 [Roseococcus sp.]|nr:hypothetical protein [Roseococcus sp.]
MTATPATPDPAGLRARIFRAENAAGDGRRNAMGSTASGPGQITDGTWRSYAPRLGLTEAQRNDRAAQERVFDACMADAQKAVGRALADGEAYAAWLLGIAGLRRFLAAGRDADALETYRAVAGRRVADQAFRQNPGLLEPGMTVGEVLDALERRIAPRPRAGR